MITYLYWGVVIVLAVLAVAVLAGRMNSMFGGLVVAAVILVGGWAAYYFHFEQIFVKRFGGVMSIAVPRGQQHISATWKNDNLWIENYDSATDTCIFSEYSRGNLLEGRVLIKRCNPLRLGTGGNDSTAAIEHERQR
jgi:hypothetical protein